jgi:hypothetical protein
MEDDRRATYQRLIERLLALPRFHHVVSIEDVIGLLADELLTERRGVRSPVDNLEESRKPDCT